MPIKFYNETARIKKAEYYQSKKQDPEFREKRRRWNKELIAKNPRPAFIRSLINNTLKPRKTNRRRSEGCLIGYSHEELKLHIEAQFISGMTWENRGSVWEIDHIKPISKFNIDEPISLINALSNLRPIWKIVNQRKAAKLVYNG